MADIGGNVLLTFKADTSQARRETQRLADQQKQLTREVIAGQEKQAAGLSSQIAMLSKVTIGIGAAVAAYKVLAASAERFAKISQLQTAAVGADISAIQKATGGLITEYEALKFAAASLNTDFKLNQQQMEEVARFMVVLRNQGNDLSEVYREVTKAIVEGNTEGLKKFGIVVKESAGTLEAHQAIMKRIADENERAGNLVSVAGDESQKAGVKWKDAIDKLVVELGKLAEALAPIVGALASVVGAIASIPGAVRAVDQALQDVFSGNFAPGTDALNASTQRRLAAFARRREGADAGDLTAADIGRSFGPGDTNRTRFITAEEGAAAAALFNRAPISASRAGRRGPSRDQQLLALAGSAAGQEAAPGIDSLIGMNAEQERVLGLLAGAEEDPTAGLRGLLDEEKAKKNVELLKQQQEAVQQFADVGRVAMETFQSAMVAALEAILDGSKSIGDALHAVTLEVLKGIRTELLALAVSEGVKAVVSAANFRFAEAGGHASAAGKAFAGAVAITGLSRILGGSGASDSGVAAGGGASLAASESQNITVILTGDQTENPRAQSQRLKRALDRARELEGEEQVVFNA